ncbi:hypothetical protein [Streptomyces sp. NBC_00878]|uniref:hypothetical protein n=1 Tax=Streptomyces sp. NBC_00878 TaxID=2975854 RepID=UPI0022589117|nr:hypothetical protein [Streptomyces sp. NBC_00878]MCX4907260.1 hypothetical protein [Streptomyces sp. NBC_00878]
MGFTLLALFLIAGAVVAAIVRRRSKGAATMSDLDAEAEANRWVVRLGGSLSASDVRARAGADRTAARELSAAAERHRTARHQLATARTPAEYAVVTRTALEGMHHIHAARTAFDLDVRSAALPDLHTSASTAGGGRPHEVSPR